MYDKGLDPIKFVGAMILLIVAMVFVFADNEVVVRLDEPNSVKYTFHITGETERIDVIVTDDSATVIIDGDTSRFGNHPISVGRIDI